MVYKFCENHLAELYEAIKNNDVLDLEKIEHELSNQEECLACVYALKAKGEVKNELLSFLKNEGFDVDLPIRETPLEHLIFWSVHLGLLILVFLIVYLPLSRFLAIPVAVIIASGAAGAVLVYFGKIFD